MWRHRRQLEHGRLHHQWRHRYRPGCIRPRSPSLFPKTNVGTCPLWRPRNHREDALALWHLYQKGVITEEFAKVKPLGFIVFPGLVIHSKKPIHDLADMKGLKISVEGRVLSTMMPRLGASPISLQPGELYASLQRGLVEAVPQGWLSVPTFHLNEVTNFHLEAPLGFNTGQRVHEPGRFMQSSRPKVAPQSTSFPARFYVLLRPIAADDTMELRVGRDATKATPGPKSIASFCPG